MGLRRIKKAYKKVYDQIISQTDRSNKYSRGLASEGYLGGYLQALSDVLAVLRKIPVAHGSERFWE